MKAVEVTLRGLTRTFDGLRALDGVSLEVPAGEFLVLLGPSGSGKTTLLRCLAGIERPSGGEILLDQRTVASETLFVAPEHRHLAMVFQDYALWPHLSVRRNVAYALERQGVERAERDRRVEDLLERVGLAHLAEHYPNQLSGGEQQRVALARALGARAGLILFDEPLSNLDADRREQLRVEIATLTRDAGATAVYITHDQSEAFALADRVALLRGGRLIQVGTPEEIYRQSLNGFVARFTGTAGELAVASLEAEGPRARVRLVAPAGVELTATLGPLGVPSHPRLFVRAAGVSLRPRGVGGELTGRIVDVAFTGRGYEHVVELAEGVTLAKVHHARRCERGEEVAVDLDPEACLVLDEEEE